MKRTKTWYFVAFFSIIALLDYFPILQGKIPFPAQVVTGFPPWEGMPSTIVAPSNRAEYGDTVTLFYPWRYFQKTALRDWELPLWNPHILSGDPFLGDTESALFYPLNAAFYVLPLHIAWPLKLMLNVVLAGTITALFVRSIGGTAAGAIAAGVVFALAGNMTTWQASNLMDAMLWLPLVFLGVHRLCSTGPDAPGFIITAIAFALPMLAGHPETVAHLTIAGSAFAIWQSFACGRSASVALWHLALFGAAGLLAIGLSSIQLIPSVEWLGQINHMLGSNWGTLKLHEALSFFSRDIATNPNSSLLQVPESASYAGALTLLVAPLALLHPRKREAVFFMIAIAVALQIVFGGPGAWLINQTPVISGVKNWRFLVVIDFGLAVLAGLGISALSETSAQERLARAWLWMGPTLCCAIAAYGIWVLHKAKQADTPWLHSITTSAVLLLIAYGLLLLRTANWLRPKTFAAMAVVLISADLVTYAHGYLPFADPSEIYPHAPVVDFLQQHEPEHGRVANLDGTYGPNFEIMYGLASVGGYDVSLRLIKRFLEDVSNATLDDVSLNASMIAASRDRRLDMLNAKYFLTTTYNTSYEALASRPDRFSLVFTDRTVRVFENRFALPRAYFIPLSERAIEILPDDDAQLRRVKDANFDPQRMVVMASTPPLPAGAPVSDVDPEPARVQFLHASANEVELSVASTQPGILVLSQIFYPGWHAVADGRETPVFRVNYALTGVALNGGARSLKFLYWPTSYRIGALVTLVSIGIVLLLALLHRNANRAQVH